MEIVSTDGSITLINPGQTRELGRIHELNSSDKTISRRHISFSISLKNQKTRLQFEVLGRNPIYVSRNDEVKIYRRFERGEMGNGDMFCVSAKDPVWYTLKQVENGGQGVRQNDSESELADNLEISFGFDGVDDLEQEGVDILDIDPVKEFGFVVMGHEFDPYPKKMIRDFKNWDWFLEETGKDSDDDDYEGKKGKGSGRRKRKKGVENDDEEWAGESDEDKELINKTRKVDKPKYTTRSKDSRKPSKDAGKSKGTTSKGTNRDVDDEDMEDEDDEDDETLGGFIVDDEILEDEELGDETVEEEEEEEIGDDDDEDE